MEYIKKTFENNTVKTNHKHTDQFALVIHYKKFTMKTYQKIEAYNLQFLERPESNYLDFVEQL